VTSRETPDISIGLRANMSLLHWRKSMSSLSYLGSKPTLICMVLVGFLASICMPLASSSILKTLDVRGISGLSGVMGSQRLNSLSSTVVIEVAASSTLLCSQSSARCVLASAVMIPVGPVILSLR
jgi:hypothetical protein